MKEITLTIHADEGHGWLYITNEQMVEYGLSKDDFSKFSYYDDEGVYAEEDVDASKVIDAVTNKGINIAFEEIAVDGLSPIRELKRTGGAEENETSWVPLIDPEPDGWTPEKEDEED